MNHESDTYLAIIDEGQEIYGRDAIRIIGEEKFGSMDNSIRDQLNAIKDLERLKRMLRRTLKAASWQEILDTP